MPFFKVATLEKRDIASAFPLVQLMRKGVDLGQWRRYAEDFIADGERGPRGILVARDPNGVMMGMLRYEMRCHIEGFHFVTATDILVYGHFQRQRGRVARALLRALERLAREKSCRFVQFELPDQNLDHIDNGIVNIGTLLRADGLELAHLTFRKLL